MYNSKKNSYDFIVICGGSGRVRAWYWYASRAVVIWGNGRGVGEE